MDLWRCVIGPEGPIYVSPLMQEYILEHYPWMSNLTDGESQSILQRLCIQNIYVIIF